MPEPVAVPPGVVWTPTELRKLPRAERNAILAQAAAQAEHEYRTNRELTDFEAFGEDAVRVFDR